MTRDYCLKIISKLKEEIVFTISLLLAAATSFISLPKVEYINFKVLILLFNLMVVICAFQDLKIMDQAAVGILSKYQNSRTISLVLILLAFFSSMVLTNDVALLTLVPLTLIIGQKSGFDVVDTIIFQTIGANIGSSLTPMGNPQNLYLFTHYSLGARDFFKVMIMFVVIGGIWLLMLNIKIVKSNLSFSLDRVEISNKKQAAVFAILFLIIILSVFEIVDYRIAFIITIVTTIYLKPILIKWVDYFLLATFACFFIFIGNLSSMEAVQNALGSLLRDRNSTYFTGILLSQIISNVPSAILLSQFTQNWKELLLGVDVGGMGTLIASLASVISYKLYINENKGSNQGRYLKKFNLYNFLSLIVLAIVVYIFMVF